MKNFATLAVYLLVFCAGVSGYGRDKEGKCPPVAKDVNCLKQTLFREANMTCFQDLDCFGTMKCCDDGCKGYECRLPIDLPVVPVIAPCPSVLPVGQNCTKKNVTYCAKDGCKKCCSHATTCSPLPGYVEKEECGRLLCLKNRCPGQGAVCVMDKYHRPSCECQECAENLPNAPVCGSDRVTYENLCHMNLTACVIGAYITVQHPGACGQPTVSTTLKIPTTLKTSKLRTTTPTPPVNICDQPMDRGMQRPGVTQTIHYYFNKHLGRCDPFLYKGKGGNQNNFKIFNDCEKRCLKTSYGRDKEGKCPPVAKDVNCLKQTLFREANMTCFQDLDCFGTMKCCDDGCKGYECRLPIDLPVVPVIAPCPSVLPVGQNCTKKNVTYCAKDGCKKCCSHATTCSPLPGYVEKEECGRLLCLKNPCPGQGAVCVMDKYHRPSCECQECAENLPNAPVCGSDRVTYENLCHMNLTACVIGAYITVQHPGACGQPTVSTTLKIPTTLKTSKLRTTTPTPPVNICDQPMDRGMQRPGVTQTIHYYFNKHLGRCDPFLYKGKGGNQNNFKIFNDCEKRCLKTIKNVCVLPKLVGPCRAAMPRWFYNKDGKCEIFTYGGCSGNGNNFRSKSECKNQCVPKPFTVNHDVCTLPKVEGPCLAYFRRWFFNASSNRCEKFIYGGCKGNANNFESRKLCTERCKPAHHHDLCKLPKVTGRCRGFFPRYFYNSTSGRCEKFIYGGCEGNANRFGNLAACEMACGFKEVKKEKTKCERQRNAAEEQANADGPLLGVFIPECEKDGSYSKVQCSGSTGYCWCVNKHGIELEGSKVPPSQHPNCTVKKTKCQQHREMAEKEANSNGLKVGVFTPKCEPDGSYSKTQCSGSTGYCWCVDKEGNELVGTSVQAPKRPQCAVPSLTSEPFDICDISLCEFGRCVNVNGLATCQCIDVCPAILAPVCGNNGTHSKTYSNFCELEAESCKRKQHITVVKSEQCAQPNPCDGFKCEFYGNCVVNKEGKPICDCPAVCTYDLTPVCGTNKKTYPNLCSMKVDSCAKQILIKKKSDGECGKPNPREGFDEFYCIVNKEGKRICDCPAVCFNEYKPVCATNNITYPNWCSMKFDSCANEGLIEKKRDGECSNCQKHLDRLSGIPAPGSWVPQCESDGSYKTVQCNPSTNHCWCVDDLGQKLVGTIVQQPKQPNCTVDLPPPRPKSNCEIERDAGLAASAGGLVGHFIPVCEKDGGYKQVQCSGSINECWCVDEKGSKLVETVVQGPKIPNCSGVLKPTTKPFDICDITLCDFGRCVNVDGNATCQCNKACPRIYDPVCGSDNETYPSACDLESKRCQRKERISVLYKGQCGVPKATTKRFDICDITLCDFGRCVNVDGNATCQCNKACPRIYDPVCGSDNETYPSACDLESKRCQRKERISVLYKGQCGVPKATTKRFDICDITLCDFGRCVNVDGKATCQCNKACPLLYDPVCGSDNETYPSACDLESKRCQRKERISVLYKGQCGVPKPTTKPFDICDITLCDFGRCVNVEGNATCQCNKACQLLYDPVCGSDNKTYPSLCDLESQSCQRKERISVLYKGQCGVPKATTKPFDICDITLCDFGRCVNVEGNATCQCNQLCPAILDPVCGSDNKTYGNPCVLESESCQRKERVSVLHKGECGVLKPTTKPFDICDITLCDFGRCVNTDGNVTCQCNMACLAIFDPVCGSDRKTYPSPCDLESQSCQRKERISVLHKGECGKTKCQSEREAAGSNRFIGVGAFIPQCEEDGSYRQVQCHGSTGYCWCVNEHGVKLEGTAVPPSAYKKPNCTAGRTKCQNTKAEAEAKATDSNGRRRIGAFIPECEQDGSFKKRQCSGSTGFCWCVNEHGVKLEGTDVAPYIIKKPNCTAPGKTKCETDRAAAEAKATDSDGRIGRGAFIPECEKDGSYKKVQCHDSTGYCWCVDKDGNKLVKTQVRYKVPQCDAVSQIDNFAARCLGPDKFYCHSIKKCIPASRKCDGKDDCGDNSDEEGCGRTKCQNTKAEAEAKATDSNGRRRIGAFIPKCEQDGSFKKRQCSGSTGFCWCVNEHGVKLEGTDVAPYIIKKPNCTAPGKTKCETDRAAAEAKATDSDGRIGRGAFIPECEKDGSYKKVQCHDSTGYCWCVDKDGNKLVKTQVRYKVPQCDAVSQIGNFAARCLGPDKFYCHSIKKCIPASRKCDGKDDCGDNSDEEGCVVPPDPCASFRCSFYSKCKINEEGKARCVCDKACTKEIDWQCGSDGKSYSNPCELMKAACEQLKNITIVKAGKCGSPVVNPCTVMKCGYHAKCELDDQGIPKCVCNKACTKELNWQCGSDGKSYANPCLLRLAECEQQQNLTNVKGVKCVPPCANVKCPYYGKCTVIDGRPVCVCQKACPKELNRQCGSDGKTYSNPCLLRLAACEQEKNITIVKAGKCGPSDAELCAAMSCKFYSKCKVIDGIPECVCQKACTSELNRQCGSDGKTYSNPCELRVAACEQQKNITIVKAGECGCAKACTRELNWQCGSDGKSYANPCELRKAACEQKKIITIVKAGKCACPVCPLTGIDQVVKSYCKYKNKFVIRATVQRVTPTGIQVRIIKRYKPRTISKKPKDSKLKHQTSSEVKIVYPPGKECQCDIFNQIETNAEYIFMGRIRPSSRELLLKVQSGTIFVQKATSNVTATLLNAFRKNQRSRYCRNINRG